MDYILIVSAAGAFVLLLILFQMMRLNYQLKKITQKLKGYMDEVCRDAEESIDNNSFSTQTSIPLTKEEKEILLSREEGEQIFNDVLQEIFQ